MTRAFNAIRILVLCGVLSFDAIALQAAPLPARPYPCVTQAFSLQPILSAHQILSVGPSVRVPKLRASLWSRRVSNQDPEFSNIRNWMSSHIQKSFLLDQKRTDAWHHLQPLMRALLRIPPPTRSLRDASIVALSDLPHALRIELLRLASIQIAHGWQEKGCEEYSPINALFTGLNLVFFKDPDDFVRTSWEIQRWVLHGPVSQRIIAPWLTISVLAAHLRMLGFHDPDMPSDLQVMRTQARYLIGLWDASVLAPEEEQILLQGLVQVMDPRLYDERVMGRRWGYMYQNGALDATQRDELIAQLFWGDNDHEGIFTHVPRLRPDGSVSRSTIPAFRMAELMQKCLVMVERPLADYRAMGQIHPWELNDLDEDIVLARPAALVLMSQRLYQYAGVSADHLLPIDQPYDARPELKRIFTEAAQSSLAIPPHRFDWISRWFSRTFGRRLRHQVARSA